MKKLFEKIKSNILLISASFFFIFINFFFINKINIIIIITILYLVCIIIFIFVIKKKNVYNIINNLMVEIKNITWTNKKELNQTILAVLAILSLVVFVLWIVDSILTYFISKIL